MELIMGLALLAALDVAALLWGASSLETVDDSEWQRRREWRGFARR